MFFAMAMYLSIRAKRLLCWLAAQFCPIAASASSSSSHPSLHIHIHTPTMNSFTAACRLNYKVIANTFELTPKKHKKGHSCNPLRPWSKPCNSPPYRVPPAYAWGHDMIMIKIHIHQHVMHEGQGFILCGYIICNNSLNMKYIIRLWRPSVFEKMNTWDSVMASHTSAPLLPSGQSNLEYIEAAPPPSTTLITNSPHTSTPPLEEDEMWEGEGMIENWEEEETVEEKERERRKMGVGISGK